MSHGFCMQTLWSRDGVLFHADVSSDWISITSVGLYHRLRRQSTACNFLYWFPCFAHSLGARGSPSAAWWLKPGSELIMKRSLFPSARCAAHACYLWREGRLTYVLTSANVAITGRLSEAAAAGATCMRRHLAPALIAASRPLWSHRWRRLDCLIWSHCLEICGIRNP
jgi:hypothetical protein